MNVKEKKELIKVGTHVKVTSRKGSGHTYDIGKEYRVCMIDGNSMQLADLDSGRQGYWIYFSEVELFISTLESMKTEIEKLESKISDLKNKIQWMEEMETDQFDSNLYKVWRALSTLESESMSKLEKAKLLAELINNK